ncbi:MAG: hypothetical protein VX962_10625, partial [Pseudomonadota bacterium]|nr:hypothetical protein [Pseudomonadota bacterium]
PLTFVNALISSSFNCILLRHDCTNSAELQSPEARAFEASARLKRETLVIFLSDMMINTTASTHDF